MVAELKEVLGGREVLQAVLADVADCERAMRVEQRPGRGREQDLPAVRRRRDSGRAVHVHPDVAGVGHDGCSGVHPYAHCQRSCRKFFLDRARSDQRISRGLEGDKERVAFRVDDNPAVRPARRFDDPTVDRQRVCVCFRTDLVEQTGRSLDVSKQKRDRTRWKNGAHLARR